jgi:hypothetical protein
MVIQATNGADTDIVKVSVDLASAGNLATVIANDDDILVVLISHNIFIVCGTCYAPIYSSLRNESEVRRRCHG